MNTKLRKTLAIVALVFMAIFSVTLVIVFVNPDLCNGAFRYAALVSGLLGVGLFLIIKFVLKEKETPDYLPKETPPGESENASDSETSPDVETEQKQSDDNGDESGNG